MQYSIPRLKPLILQPLQFPIWAVTKDMTHSEVFHCNISTIGRSIDVQQETRKPSFSVGHVHVHRPGVACPACASAERAMQGPFADLTFNEALPLWLQAHKPYISPRTYWDYDQYSKPLLAFFGPLQLRHIGIYTVRGYQAWRWKHAEAIAGEMQSKYLHAADSVRIKNEINSVLKPVLREGGIWEEIEKKKFNHLPVPTEEAGQALTLEQQDQIFEVGFSRPKWHLPTHCMRVMYRTGTGFGELRKLRFKDVDLVKGTITIYKGAKNTVRKRTVALVPSALESMAWIIQRYLDHGGTKAPGDYVLFHRKKMFAAPMTSTYRGWIAIREEWLKRYPGIARDDARQSDARVSTASLLLGNPQLSLPTIEKALGWTPSSAMRKRYNRVDIDNQRSALATLERAK